MISFLNSFLFDWHLDHQLSSRIQLGLRNFFLFLGLLDLVIVVLLLYHIGVFNGLGLYVVNSFLIDGFEVFVQLGFNCLMFDGCLLSLTVTCWS